MSCFELARGVANVSGCARGLLERGRDEDFEKGDIGLDKLLENDKVPA